MSRSTLRLIVSTFIFTITSSYQIIAQCNPGETFYSYCYTENEMNTVAFEVCPSAGFSAQAEIIQGTFDTFFGDNLTVYQGAPGSGTSGTIVFGPMTGDVSGNIIMGNVADECLIFVINSDEFLDSCGDAFQAELQVCGSNIAPSVTFTAPADLCLNAGVQAGLSGGSPSGGVYSGMAGVIDDGNGMTYSFDPAAAGVGVHTITYTLGMDMASDDVEVFAPGSTMFTALADLCIDAGVQSGLGGGSPSGGVYSGPGVMDDGNGMTYTFDPAEAGLGVHTLSYSLPDGCMETVMDDVEVLAACGCPMPQTSHFYCYDNNEVNSVAFEVCPSAGMAAEAMVVQGSVGLFLNDDDLTIYSGAPGSGNSGTVIAGPMMGDFAGMTYTGNVADECLIFVINSGPVGSCADDFETALEVCGSDVAPSIAFTAPDDLCITDGVQTGLSGGTPSGGVYSGFGVVDDMNGMTYSFDPAIAGVGTTTITYTLGMDMASDDVEVFDNGITTFTALADLCEDAGVQSGLSGGSPSGGVYSGPGVTDDGNGMTYSFDPAIAGVGVHTITYASMTPCMETAMDDVEVLEACGCPAPQASFFYCYGNDEVDAVAFELCPTPGFTSKITINQGTFDAFDDNLTVYQGAMGSGTSGTIVFGPIAGDVSGNVITATVPDECLIFIVNSGPVTSCMDGFELALSACGEELGGFVAPDDLCIDAGVQTGLSGGFPTGGVYDGPGVMDDMNGMTYSFDPAAAGVGIHTLTYTENGNIYSDDVEVFAIPQVSMEIGGTFCDDEAPSTQMPVISPTGGVFSGSGVTDDLNGMTFTFDPSMSGTGPITITYTFTDANGCSDSATGTLQVNPTPVADFTIAPFGCTLPVTVDFTDMTTNNPDTWLWDFGDGNMSTMQNPSNTYTSYGNYTIELIVEDTITGCNDTTSMMITIEDTDPPSLTCPADQTENPDANCEFVLPDYTPLVMISDMCDPNPSLVQSPPPGTTISMNTTITMTGTDSEGNSDTCTFEVLLLDATPPMAMCNATFTAVLAADGTYTFDAQADLDNGSTDNCGITSYVANPAAVSCADIGMLTVELIVTDMAGNSATCTTEVTVVDNMPPSITCPADIEVDNDPGECGAQVMVPMPVTDDNCSVMSVVNDFNGTDDASGFYEIGTTTVMWTVTDVAGNTTTCSHTVTVNDVEPIMIDCGVLTTIEADNYTIANYAFNYIDITGTGTNFLSGDDVTATITLGAPALLYENNFAQLSASTNGFLTTDITAPPSDLGNSCPASSGNDTDIRLLVMHDDLDSDPGQDPIAGVYYQYFASSPVPAPDGSFPGVSVFQWRTDHFNGTGTADIDMEALIFDNGEIVYQYNLAGVETGSGSTQGIINHNAMPVLSTTISCNTAGTVTNGSAVALIPPAPPMDPVTFPTDPGECSATLDLSGPPYAPVVTDNCMFTLVNDYNGTDDASDVYPEGETVVNWTATDTFGNVVTCSQTIIVVDEEGPQLMCPDNIQLGLQPGECETNVIYDIMYTDNCSMDAVISQNVNEELVDNSIDCSDPVLFAYHLRRFDNSASVNPISFQDISYGIFNSGGGADITINVYSINSGDPLELANLNLEGSADHTIPAGVTNAIMTENIPVSISPGMDFVLEIVTPVSPDFVMGYNNEGQTAPSYLYGCTIEEPTDLATLGLPATFSVVLFVANVTLEQTAGLPSGSFFPIGTTTQTFVATDAFGNTSTCTFDVTVLEYPTPTSSLSCNNGLNVSMSPDCEVEVTADMILEGGPYGCYDDYIITVSGITGTTITTPGNYTVTVTDPDTGNSCWGSINVEDKLPPQLECDCPEGGTTPAGTVFNNFSEALTADDDVSDAMANACLNFGGGAPIGTGHFYDEFAFEFTVTGTYNIAQNTDWGDGQISYYSQPFNPDDVCANLLGGSSDVNGFDPEVMANFNAGQTYYFVFTSWGGGTEGDYDVEVDGPGDMVLAEGIYAPECLYSCTQLESVMGGYVDVPMPTVTGGCSGFNLAFTDYVTAGEVCGQQILQRVWYVTDVTGTITDQCVSEYIFNAVSFGEISLPPALVELPCGTGTDPEDIEAFFDNPLTTDVAMSANCPLDIEENNEGIPFAYPHYFAIGCNNVENPQAVNNNVCNIYATYSDQFIPACGSGCDGNTKVIRTWTLLNWCDASTTEFVQIIKSIDQEAPTFVATDVFASVEVHSCVAHIEMPQPWELHDNCDENPDYSVQGPAGVAITGNSTDGYVALNVPKGVHTFTYLATDCCGNVGSQTVTVTVEDNTAPVPVATQNIVISLSSTTGDGQGTAKLFASSVDNGSHDSCSDVKIEIRRDSDNCGVNGNATYNADGHPQDGNPLIDTDGGQFVKFCCADLTEVDGNGVPFGIHKVWMRVFDDGDMNGIFGTAGDNYNEIWVNVRVEDKLAPAIVCPPDITIECDEDYTDLDLTGEAEAFGTCDGLAVEYTDTPFLDACNEGFVQRRWFIAGNPFGTFCIQRITIVREDPPFNGVITWPQDMTVNCTDANPGEPTWTAGPCDVIGYDVDSDTFLFEDGACFKILNEYTVIDWCQYEPNSPFWNGEGIWTHTQIIKVIDNVPPEITCEDAMYAVNDNNDADGDGNLCENRAVMLTNSAVDGGGDCMSEWLKWQVEVDVWGDGTTDYVFSSFVPPFSPFYIAPTGSNEEVKVTIPEDIESSMSNHKVFWQVTDGCGNNAGCQNTFMVVDKKAPTPYCVSLSSALMDESGEVELWAIDFNIGSFDNCSEQEDLRYTFSSTPPENDPLYDEDLRSSSQVFDCDDLPQVTVNMYVWDEKGNSDFCVVTLNLVDNNDVCPDNFGNRIAGQIETEQGEGVQEVEVSLMSNLPESPVDVMTDGAGAYAFPDNPAGIDYTVAPAKDGDYMNGVSTLDLVLIQRHILNLEQFNSPYKVIAADINYDAKVSAADLVDLRKLILGVNTELANNMSWRFVDADQEFAEVTNPWPFDEVIDIASLNGDMNDNDFVGVKIGDVNGSAESNLTANSSEVRSANTLTLTVAEQTIEAGQTVEVTLNSADFAEVYGYQFTMELNGLSYTGVTGGAAAMNASNVGVLKSNLVTVSYSNSAAVTAGAEEGIFTMTFTAEKAGQLSEMMKITSRATRAEAYVGSSLEIQDIELTIRTENGQQATDNYVLNQNEPNPFKDQTTVSFYAPESASATITVYDVTGKVVMVRDMEAVKGHNDVNFTQSELGTSGILYYQLESGDFTATKKMIIIE